MPPPPGQGVNSIGLQEQNGREQKKSKFGEYGNTMAHSAAGGVGFGAGASFDFIFLCSTILDGRDADWT